MLSQYQNDFEKYPPSVKHAMHTDAMSIEFNGGYHCHSEIIPYLRADKLYISLKEIPSCQTLRMAGSDSISKNFIDLERFDFPMQGKRRGESHWTEVQNAPAADNSQVESGQKSFLSSLLKGTIEYNSRKGSELLNIDETSEEEFIDESDYEEEDSYDRISPGEADALKLDYSDIFATLATISFKERTNQKLPEVFVWHGDVIRLSDKIPTVLMPTWNGKKGKVPFYDIMSVETKMEVLMKHTFWGKKLIEMKFSKIRSEECFAKTLLRKISYFLKGRGDPTWTKAKTEKVYAFDRPREQALQRSRAARLCQMLVTIDGIFLQKFLSYPEMRWDWERFDNFVLGNLDSLISEEFHDGSITEYSVNRVKSVYKRLKEVRQTIKSLSCKGKYSELIEILKEDSVSRMFLPEVILLSREHERFREINIRGILMQTRGCGTPPPVETAKAMIKTIETLSQPQKRLTQVEVNAFHKGIDMVLEEIPDYAMTGLSTKAAIRIQATAAFEKTRAEGGGEQAIAEIMNGYHRGRKAKIINLETGKTECFKTLEECESIGEYVFWVCLEDMYTNEIEDVKVVKLVGVKVPGKVRIASKGTIARKIVFDVVNGVCSWVLGKAIESSKSGMTKESHAWEAAKGLIKSPECWVESQKTSRALGNCYKEETITFEPLYAGSTDFKMATDFMDFERCSISLTKYMKKCGIPPFLRGVVVATSLRPRIVHFTAHGVLEKYGEPVEGCPGVRKFQMNTGILQGDPLTKVALHLVNVVTRRFAIYMCESGDLKSRNLPYMPWARDMTIPGHL